MWHIKNKLYVSGNLLCLWCLWSASAVAIDIQHWTQNNGARVLLVERHDNPIIDIDVAFDAGSRRDNPQHIGVADMANGLLDSGTQQDSEEILRAKIDDLAVTVQSYGELERGGVRIRSLSKPDTLSKTIIIANQMLVSPRYDANVLQREKTRAIASLQQGLTQPGFLADRATSQQNYPSHPYGYGARETTQTITAINRQQLLDFHKKYYQTNQAVVAIVGDVTRTQAQNLVDKLLHGLPHQAQAAALPAVPPGSGRQQAIPHPATQAHIILSMPLITRDDPDYYALLVGNYILGGGGFDSRLMQVLRDRKGLTYGVYSNMNPLQASGPFTIALSTKKASTEEALTATRQVLADFIANGPTEQELTQAKANIIGGFPLRFDSNAKLIGYLGVMGFYRLPDDFLDTYPAKVEKLTAAQIQAVWQRRIKPADINSVVVGGK